MRRPQFTLRSLLVTILVVAAFFSGIHFEQERRNRKDAELAAKLAKSARKPLIAKSLIFGEEKRRQETVIQEFQEKLEAERPNDTVRQRSASMPMLKGWHDD